MSRDREAAAVQTPASEPAVAKLDIIAVQAALKADGIDAWLLYDFRGLNPIACNFTGVGRQGGHLATRRWYYLIPAAGEPRGLVHSIERETLAHLPGAADRYSGRNELEGNLGRLLAGARRVAMEYSAKCAIPYISRVDAGTVELVRQFGVEVVSSGDLVQRFVASWDAAAIGTHERASEKLHRIKDRAFGVIGQRIGAGTPMTEYDIQQLMAGWFREEGLVSDSDPIVSVGANAGKPHYLPTATVHHAIGPEVLVLLDLWGKLDRPGAVFADITWMGYTGRRVPTRYAEAFAVDRAASAVLGEAGYGDHILHRTGHSLGESVHGNGVNMDDYETHDDRRLLPGTGFTVEPGVYFDDFGVRSEINMIVRSHDAVVTGPLQTEILALL